MAIVSPDELTHIGGDMLTKQDRLMVVKKLARAFYTYRNLPIWITCKRAKLTIRKIDDEFGGTLYQNAIIEYPGKAPRIGKEYVFWHEFCHWLLEQVLEYPRFIGYQGMLQQNEEEYWVHERLCEAFASLMVLYRRGVIGRRGRIRIGQWIFNDTRSVGYAEVIGAVMDQAARARNEASAARSNADLSEIDTLLEWMKRHTHRVPFQQMLPTNFRDCHQTPWISYVGERDDLLVNERHWHKESWKLVHPTEQQLMAELNSIRNAHSQLSLFDEIAQADRSKLKKRYERFERAVERFRQT